MRRAVMSEPKPCQKCGRDYSPLRRGYCHRCDMQRRARHGYQCSYVDAAPAREHVTALRAAGIGLRRLEVLSGVSRSALTSLVNGRAERGSGPSKRVSAATAHAILAVDAPEVPHHGVADNQLVAAIGTVRRMQALVANGHPRRALAQRLGIAPSNAGPLFDTATRRITAATARKVDALFNELETTAGPSTRARNEGRRRGWPLPLQWDADTLDDPAAAAASAVGARVGFDVRYRELRALGYSDAAIAGREGIQLESLYQRLRRLGITAEDRRAG